MSRKNKEIMDREGAGRLLEKLGKNMIEKGTIELWGREIQLPENFEVELEYKEKHGKKELEIELKWYDEPISTTKGVTIQRENPDDVRIATMDEISPGKVIKFAYPADKDRAILIALPDGELRAYSTLCPHKGGCVLWDDQLKKLHCPEHEAIFDPATGEKLQGPGGKYLRKIHLQIRANSVFAVGIDSL